MLPLPQEEQGMHVPPSSHSHLLTAWQGAETKWPLSKDLCDQRFICRIKNKETNISEKVLATKIRDKGLTCFFFFKSTNNSAKTAHFLKWGEDIKKTVLLKNLEWPTYTWKDVWPYLVSNQKMTFKTRMCILVYQISKLLIGEVRVWLCGDQELTRTYLFALLEWKWIFWKTIWPFA